MLGDNDNICSTVREMGEMQWHLVGDVETLRQTPCRRLRCVSSPTRGQQSLTQPTDLVLVYVSKLDKFFALDGICAHVGMSVSFTGYQKMSLFRHQYMGYS